MKDKTTPYKLSDINKIRKLATKKGTPLLEVKFNKKSIHFHYQTRLGMIGFSYPSALKGIRGEIRRLGK